MLASPCVSATGADDATRKSHKPETLHREKRRFKRLRKHQTPWRDGRFFSVAFPPEGDISLPL